MPYNSWAELSDMIGRSLSVWHLSRCRVALRPAVLSAARIWPSVSRCLEISFGLRGPSPRLLPPFEGGWVHCPVPEAPLTRGMPTGPRAFLANSGHVWATALRPVPPKKRPCAIHARKVGRASNTAERYDTKSNVKLGGFRSQLQASYVSSHTEE